MLVLARTPGRSIYFGRFGAVTVEQIFKNGTVTLSFEVAPHIKLSVGATSREYHEMRQVELDAARSGLPEPERATQDAVRCGHRMSISPGMWVWIGKRGRIVLEEVGRGQAKLGFDLPATEAVSRDDYPIQWHLDQQTLREQRKPANGTTTPTRG